MNPMNMAGKALSTGRKMKFRITKNSPGILMVLGGIGVVAAGVMACRATTKLSDITDDMEEKLEEIHELAENKEDKGENVDKKEIQRKTTQIYIITGLRIARLYAPSVFLGVLSLTGMFKSLNISQKHNARLAAAYAGLYQGSKEYQKRVIDRFGEEVEKEIRLGIHDEEIEEKVVNEKGKEKTIKKKIKVADPNLASPYAKYFTRSNPWWENDPDVIGNFFKARENYFNDRLIADGHFTLNEAYEQLGFKKTVPGFVVGWTRDDRSDKSDGYIKLKIDQVCLPTEDGEYDMAYAIDFNVDGNIYEKLKKNTKGGVLG